MEFWVTKHLPLSSEGKCWVQVKFDPEKSIWQMKNLKRSAFFSPFFFFKVTHKFGLVVAIWKTQNYSLPGWTPSQHNNSQFPVSRHLWVVSRMSVLDCSRMGVLNGYRMVLGGGFLEWVFLVQEWVFWVVLEWVFEVVLKWVLGNCSQIIVLECVLWVVLVESGCG